MTRLQYLLCKLAEEASEVSQIALKTSYFGLEDSCPDQPYTNKERIHQELNDLLATISMLNGEFNLDYKQDKSEMILKQTKINKYYIYAKQLGMIT